jgi:hypothetical protein
MFWLRICPQLRCKVMVRGACGVLAGTVTGHAPYQRSTSYSLDPMYVKALYLEAVVVTHTFILAVSSEFSHRMASVLMSV